MPPIFEAARADHEAQALAFLAWHRKRGQSLEDDFGAWSRSKDFGPRDLLAIRTIAVEEITAGGPAHIDLARIFGGITDGAA